MTYQFKSNINCGSCINAVSTILNPHPEIEHWEVDVTVPEKVLSVKTVLSADQVINEVAKAGFTAELLPSAMSV
jgi:copper chaperone CopZ